MQKIAFIGLGTMGSAMAKNLLAAGFSVSVYNRTRERSLPLQEFGAEIADTPKAAAQNAEAVFTMVTDDAASRAVWLGEQGILAGANPHAILIESSTVSPDWIRELSDRAQGFQLLDAPVAGSQPQAIAKELIFLVGGDRETVTQAQPIFQAMGKSVMYFGSIGSGILMKLISNLMVGVQVATLAEALNFAQHSGLDMEQVVQALSNGSAGSPVVRAKAAQIAAQNFTPNFALHLLHKDLGYALEEAGKQNAPLPTTAISREFYRMAMSQGLGDRDFVAISQVFMGRESRS
jgi:3-hydroxyisobutyrate dehydrogenase